MRYLFLLLLTVFTSAFIISCSSDDDGTGASFSEIIAPEFLGEWVRNDLVNTDCEQNKNVTNDGDTANESQGAYLTVTNQNVNYAWTKYIDDGDCDFSTSVKSLSDTLLQDVVVIAYTANDTTTVKATVGGLQRTASGSATELNAFNGSGACGKSNWINGDIINISSLTCNAIGGGSIGMDDFTFASESVGDIFYWRFTISGANLLIETSTDNVTYNAANTYYKKP